MKIFMFRREICYDARSYEREENNNRLYFSHTEDGLCFLSGRNQSLVHEYMSISNTRTSTVNADLNSGIINVMCLI